MSASQEKIETKEKKGQASLTQLPRLFVSRRWWWMTILVVVGIVITFRLGIWQLDRLQQRRARNTEYIEQISAYPLVLDGAPLPVSPNEMRDRPALVEGQFDFEEQIILVQQNYEGRPGAHLVAPFIVDGSETAVLVDRGWVPAHEIEAGDLRRFSDTSQDTVEGSLQPSHTLSRGRESEIEGPQIEWYRIDIESIQDQVPYKLLPVYLMEKPAASIQDELPYKVEPEIDLSEGSHLGYAIQWFFFCSMLLVGYSYFVKTRSTT
jgi:surfeit locus 1 family protein